MHNAQKINREIDEISVETIAGKHKLLSKFHAAALIRRIGFEYTCRHVVRKTNRFCRGVTRPGPR